MRSYARIISAKLHWLWPVVVFGLVWWGMQYSAPLYHQPIARITAVQTTSVERPVDNFNNHDRLVHQRLQAVLLNTEKRHQQLVLHNTYSQSGAEDAPLGVGAQVFLATNAAGHYTITNIKRDAIVAALGAATLVLLAQILTKRFWLTMTSIIANAVVFAAAVRGELLSHGVHAFALFAAVTVVFAVICTLFVVGFKPLAAVVAGGTILATGLGVALGYAVFTVCGYQSLHLETVKYVTQAPELLFFVQIIIGSLGAVLDECSDIAVAILQLESGAKARFQAGMVIGRNVMGPLITVLFMIFIAETFAEAVLWLRNGNAISTTVSWVMGLGFAQSLISAFGIVLAVPLTSGLAAAAAWWQDTRRRAA